MMRAASRIWCTGVDRDVLRSERRLQRLLDAGAYGFSVRSEDDARYVLAMLDATRPYADFMVACEAPVRTRVMHPNFALAFSGRTYGVRGFREAIASGTNAILKGPSVLRAARAYVAGLRERHRRGFPLFVVRGVLAFEHLSDADIRIFNEYFKTSCAFSHMRMRGARVPLLVCARRTADRAILTTLPCAALIGCGGNGASPQPISISA